MFKLKIEMKNLLWILLAFSMLCCQGQKVKSSTRKIVDRIEKYNILDYEHVYEQGKMFGIQKITLNIFKKCLQRIVL